MQLHPDIRALLEDPARLRAQQAVHTGAFDAWRKGPQGAALLAAFAAFAAGAPLSGLPPLAALFDGSGTARAMVGGLAGALLPAFAEAPFGQVPLRHHASRTATTVLLAREAEASLTLVALDGTGLAQQSLTTSAAFAQAEEWDVVVAGSGTGRLVAHVGAPGVTVHPLVLEPGLALGRDGGREALLVDRAEGTLLLLRLRRATPGPAPVREFDIASGAMIHQSAATARESRSEIAVALLGKMGRKDAAPVLAELARNAARSDMLRWQALRECLALDTLTGFRTLAALALREADPLARAAGVLRAQLIEQHPVLQEIEPCPA